jgi:hypothetical protein
VSSLTFPIVTASGDFAVQLVIFGSIDGFVASPKQDAAGKIATALAVAGAAVLGWILRGHVNFLDLEHVVAFGIGVGVAVRLSSVASTRRVELGAAGA